jgi:cytochrome c oxidase subunit 2
MTTKESMNINSTERLWGILAIATLVGFLIAITIASLAYGVQVPAPVERVNPNTLAQQEPWSKPGLRELAPGKYEVYIIAQSKTWQFNPNKIEIPAGSTLTFYVTSTDVQHGFRLMETNINMQIVPGQVSKLTARFDKPGEYKFICTEYCGAGHAAMSGSLIVK